MGSDDEHAFVATDEMGLYPPVAGLRMDYTTWLIDVDVPGGLLARLSEASVAYSQALEAVVDAAGVDEARCRMRTPCGHWEGDDDPGFTHWLLYLPAELDGTWPEEDQIIATFDDEQEAEEKISGLPGEFQVPAREIDYRGEFGELYFPTSSGAGRLELVRKDRVRLDPCGFEASSSLCFRCGWRREDHVVDAQRDPSPGPSGIGDRAPEGRSDPPGKVRQALVVALACLMLAAGTVVILNVIDGAWTPWSPGWSWTGHWSFTLRDKVAPI